MTMPSFSWIFYTCIFLLLTNFHHDEFKNIFYIFNDIFAYHICLNGSHFAKWSRKMQRSWMQRESLMMKMSLLMRSCENLMTIYTETSHRKLHYNTHGTRNLIINWWLDRCLECLYLNVVHVKIWHLWHNLLMNSSLYPALNWNFLFVFFFLSSNW